MKNKKVVIGVGAGLLSLMLIAGVTKFSSQPQPNLMPETQTENTYVIPNQKKVILSGSVVPVQNKMFTNDLTKGEELSIHVNHGDTVLEGDVLMTYHNSAITSQIEDINEQIEKLNANKSKFLTEGTQASKSANKQIKSLEDQKSKLQQETKSQVNQILNKLDGFVKQKNELNPDDENYAVLLAEINDQIESCYVQKNELEYNLPTQVSDFDEQISDLKNQLSDEDQETFNNLDDQINNLIKDKTKLQEKEYIKELAPFNGVVSLIEDSSSENPIVMKLKSPEFYVTTSVSEKDYAKLSVGMEADILLIALNKTVSGKITFIDEDPMQTSANGASSSASTYLVKVSLDDQAELVNGYQAQISLKLNNQNISIPTEAIVLDGGSHYVYIQTDEEIVKQKVEIGEEEAGYTSIKAGLREKDAVLLNPSEGEHRE